MNTDKHTPGPWISERGGTISAAGRVVATCGMGMQHNAAHIVRCVNAHDDLLAALRLAADFIENVTDETPDGTERFFAAREAWRNALAKAGAA